MINLTTACRPHVRRCLISCGRLKGITARSLRCVDSLEGGSLSASIADARCDMQPLALHRDAHVLPVALCRPPVHANRTPANMPDAPPARVERQRLVELLPPTHGTRLGPSAKSQPDTPSTYARRSKTGLRASVTLSFTPMIPHCCKL